MICPPPELLARLKHDQQDHLLVGWEMLPEGAQAALLEQVARIDLAELKALHAGAGHPPEALPAAFGPAPITPAAFTPEEVGRGADALRRGQVAALLVAGGQGSRLGALQPKGLFPAAAVSGASLYQIHAEKVLGTSRRYGHPVPFLVMTSPATDAQTREFFAGHRDFGLAPGQVTFFQQGTMPAVCARTGRVLLEAPGRLFLSPNGHGGTLTALADSGVLGDIAARGVEHVFYFQVDNPLVKVCEPGFIGRHILTRSEASSKAVAKELPEEKVGVLVEVNGRCSIIEYTQLPKHLAEQCEVGGALRFRAGSPAIHLFSVGFLERVTRTAAGSLPYRTALKAVAHFDPLAGQLVAALRRETDRIPIVFGTASDPVAVGLMKSIARPGGNITGFTGSLLAGNASNALVTGGTTYGVFLGGVPNFTTAAVTASGATLGVAATGVLAADVGDATASFCFNLTFNVGEEKVIP